MNFLDDNGLSERLDNLKKTDTLFLAASNGPQDVYFDWFGGGTSSNWIQYMGGYEQAAEILLEHATGNEADRLVFSIIFLYRQNIELQLKFIIQLGNRLLPQPYEKWNQTHDLMSL